MVRKLNLFILFFFFVSMNSPLFAASQPLLVQDKEEAMGTAPDFRLADSDNNQVSLSDFKDKPVILFFWTTWCPFCRKELKELTAEYGNFQKDAVELLPINVGEPISKVKKFVDSNGILFRILLDEDSMVADSYDVLGVPTYVYIDKSGSVSSKGHSFSKGEYLKLISK